MISISSDISYRAIWSQHQWLYFQVAWECNLEPVARNGILPAIPSGPIFFFSWPFHVRNSYSVFGWLAAFMPFTLSQTSYPAPEGSHFSLLTSELGGNFAEVQANRFWFQCSSYECLLPQKVSLHTLMKVHQDLIKSHLTNVQISTAMYRVFESFENDAAKE